MSEPEVPEKTPLAREAREKPTLTRTGTKPQAPQPCSQSTGPATR